MELGFLHAVEWENQSEGKGKSWVRFQPWQSHSEGMLQGDPDAAMSEQRKCGTALFFQSPTKKSLVSNHHNTHFLKNGNSKVDFLLSF